MHEFLVSTEQPYQLSYIHMGSHAKTKSLLGEGLHRVERVMVPNDKDMKFIDRFEKREECFSQGGLFHMGYGLMCHSDQGEVVTCVPL